MICLIDDGISTSKYQVEIPSSRDSFDHRARRDRPRVRGGAASAAARAVVVGRRGRRPADARGEGPADGRRDGLIQPRGDRWRGRGEACGIGAHGGTSRKRRSGGVPAEPQARGIDPVLGRAVERLAVGAVPHGGPPDAARKSDPPRRGGRHARTHHGDRQRHLVPAARQRAALRAFGRRDIRRRRYRERHKCGALVATGPESLVYQTSGGNVVEVAGGVHRQPSGVVVPDPQVGVRVARVGRVEGYVREERQDVAAAAREAHEPPAVAVVVVGADEEPPGRCRECRRCREEGRGVRRRGQRGGRGADAGKPRLAAVDRPRGIARAALEEPLTTRV